MDLGSVAPVDRRRVDRPAAARGHCSAGVRPQLPGRGPVLRPPARLRARPTRARCCARRDVELAFLGLIPQKFTATQLLYRTTDMHGEPEAAVTTVMVPAERAARGPSAPSSPTSAPSTPWRRAASRPTRCADGAKAVGARGAVRVPPGRRRAGRGLGGRRCPTTRAPPACGAHPTSPATTSSTALRAALNHERFGLSPPSARSACGATPAAGWPRAWAAEVQRHVRPGTQRRRRRARLPRRRPRTHLPPPQRQHLRPACPRWWSPRCRTSIPTWTGSSRSTPPRTARRLLAPHREDDHRRTR